MKKYLIFVVILIILNSGMSSIGLSHKSKSPNNFDMVIITPKIFISAIQPLVDHKNYHNIQTIVKDVEEIYLEYEGKDDAEKIKYFIKDALEEWNITYVLLFGGRKDQSAIETYWIPVRYSYLNRGYGHFSEQKFISDLYFSDIYDDNDNFSSWDTDNDGVFGEWPENSSAEDIPDLFPDVYVGRLPCRNVFEARTVVQKIIKYENRTVESSSWFTTMAVVAGDTYPNRTNFYDGEVYTQMAIDMMPEFTHVKLWTSNGSLKSPYDVIKTINKGCGFIYYSGHGNPAQWVTHPPDNSELNIFALRLRDIPFLLNFNKLPVCITGSGCWNSIINVSLFFPQRNYAIPHCLSWGLVSKAYGGCIAMIAATAISYDSPDIKNKTGGIEWLDIHFFEQYGCKNIKILGEAWAKTITSFLDNFSIDWSDPSHNGDALIVKNVEQWLLIGDPSLKIGGYKKLK